MCHESQYCVTTYSSDLITLLPPMSLPSLRLLRLLWTSAWIVGRAAWDLFVQGYKIWSGNPFYQLSDLTRLKQTIRKDLRKLKIASTDVKFCFVLILESECNFLDCIIIVVDHLTNWSSAGSISQHHSRAIAARSTVFIFKNFNLFLTV